MVGRLGVSDFYAVRSYLRFVVVEGAFGGLTVRKRARELLFGYTDRFLETFKNLDPAMGGDPSIDPVIHLNELNSTRE